MVNAIDQLFNHTIVRFISVVLIIVYPHKQDFATITFQRLGIPSVLNLLQGSVGSLVILQFYHQCRLSSRGQRQKYNIRKTAACRQLPNNLVVLSCAVICKTNGAAEGVSVEFQ